MRVAIACVGGVLAFVAAGLSGGCESANSSEAAVDRRVKTVDSIQGMRDDLTKADAQVVETQQALERLTTQRAGDLEKSYRQFKSEVAGNEGMSDRINARASSLTGDSYRQINEWNYQSRTIRDEELRQKSLDQEAVAKREHDEMVATLNDLRGAYTDYIRSLEDIETFAANNLTPHGLEGLADQRAKAAELSRQLRQKMAVMDSRLDRLAAAWQSNVPLAERIRDGGAVPAATQVQGGEAGDVPANAPVRADDR